MRNIIVKIKNSDNELIAIDEIALPSDIDITDLDATIEVVDVPPRPRRKQDRSPLHPDALVLADLRVGMRIRVHYTGDCPWAYSYSAIVAGKPKKEERDVIIIPLFRLDTQRYYTGYAPDMGLTRYGWGSYSWSPVRYVTAED